MDLRIENLRKEIVRKNLDAVLISSSSNIFYLSGVSFFDPAEHEGFLIISKNKNYLISSSLYSEAVKPHLKNFRLMELSVGRNLSKNLEEISRESKIKVLGFEEDDLRVSEYKAFRKFFKLKPTNQIVQILRQIKDDSEIEKIKKACEITDKCFEFIIKQLKVGVTEIEIANKIRRYFEDLGFKESFPAIVAFGSHSSMPHHVSNATKLKRNQIVLMDFGMSFQGYASDMTRTVFFGKAEDKFKNIYNTVLQSQTKAFEYLNKTRNPSLKTADKIAREYILGNGFGTIPHSLGHSVGIEVHDGMRLSPASKDTAKTNTVFTLEPGIYTEGFGGVRIEDVVLYKNKLSFLTHSNRSLIEI